jgi:hypothetical protein
MEPSAQPDASVEELARIVNDLLSSPKPSYGLRPPCDPHPKASTSDFALAITERHREALLAWIWVLGHEKMAEAPYGKQHGCINRWRSAAGQPQGMALTIKRHVYAPERGLQALVRAREAPGSVLPSEEALTQRIITILKGDFLADGSTPPVQPNAEMLRRMKGDSTDMVLENKIHWDHFRHFKITSGLDPKSVMPLIKDVDKKGALATRLTQVKSGAKKKTRNGTPPANIKLEPTA